MINTRTGAAAGLALTLALLGGIASTTAFAQSAKGTAGTMPLPPSASDPLPKATAPTEKKATRSARQKRDASESSGSSTDYRNRLEGSDMQLEDDPRVRPTMEGGRPGLGMKF